MYRRRWVGFNYLELFGSIALSIGLIYYLSIFAELNLWVIPIYLLTIISLGLSIFKLCWLALKINWFKDLLEDFEDYAQRNNDFKNFVQDKVNSGSNSIEKIDRLSTQELNDLSQTNKIQNITIYKQFLQRYFIFFSIKFLDGHTVNFYTSKKQFKNNLEHTLLSIGINIKSHPINIVKVPSTKSMVYSQIYNLLITFHFYLSIILPFLVLFLIIYTTTYILLAFNIGNLFIISSVIVLAIAYGFLYRIFYPNF